MSVFPSLFLERNKEGFEFGGGTWGKAEQRVKSSLPMNANKGIAPPVSPATRARPPTGSATASAT
ncbi:hypothetical protein, partial [Arthrobacter castelli]|uniref:hypothetical protein n=1 Tax=Arthrobacter castelli TaxID=271431 RepID=UPI001B7FC4CE